MHHYNEAEERSDLEHMELIKRVNLVITCCALCCLFTMIFWPAGIMLGRIVASVVTDRGNALGQLQVRRDNNNGGGG